MSLAKNEIEIRRVIRAIEGKTGRGISYAKSQAVLGRTGNFPGKALSQESVGAALKIYYVFDTSLSEALTYSWTC